jgi:hypothetical protein
MFALAVEAAAMSVLLVAEATTQERLPREDRTTEESASFSSAGASTKVSAAVAPGSVVNWLRKRTKPTDIGDIARRTLR